MKVVDFGIADRRRGGHAAHPHRRDAGHARVHGARAVARRRGRRTRGHLRLGIVLSEMLTGRHPLQGRGRDRNVHLTGPFAAIVARCLHADPIARYASARDLVAELGSRAA